MTQPTTSDTPVHLSTSLPSHTSAPPNSSATSLHISSDHIPSNPSLSNSTTSISPTIKSHSNLSRPSHPMTTRSRMGTLKPKVIFDLYHSLSSSPDPTCYSIAVKISYWRKAMSEEFNALQNQGTWSLVPPPFHQSIIGCKWTYHTKLNDDGSIACYKARLVAQGHKQEYGIDYTETFSPVAKITSIHILLTIATFYKWSITQLDISNAFLHGFLNETAYMTQPIGFVDPQFPNHVCKLHKALYGLK